MKDSKVPDANALARPDSWAFPEALALPKKKTKKKNIKRKSNKKKNKKKINKKVKFMKKGACTGTCPENELLGNTDGIIGDATNSNGLSANSENSNANANNNSNTNVNQIIIYVLPGSAVLTGANISSILPAGALPFNGTLGPDTTGGVLIVPGTSGTISTTGSESKTGSKSGKNQGSGEGHGSATASVGQLPIASSVLVPLPLDQAKGGDSAQVVEPNTGGVVVVNTNGELQIVQYDTLALYDENIENQNNENQSTDSAAVVAEWGFKGTDVTFVDKQTTLFACADSSGYGVVYAGQVPESCPGSQPLELVMT
ncbi:uncharacterized protein SAPINGB_P000427 [Magnusiomyces paraingens]|uniref:Uncharacterized protein n=1 Tax=Magnusiomyces paraingens TaxID=2606893 RepID=A0A5E8B0Z2_9ASCO|nr:uncharacterized protein SAPINGB_P000427 [Saprochaete ingens]VVT44470.1 unnamed protein product [Saprochaete ingens]